MTILALLLATTAVAEEHEGRSGARRIPTFGGGRHHSHAAPPRTLASCIGPDGSMACLGRNKRARENDASDGQATWLAANVFAHTRLRDEPGVFVEFGARGGVFTSNTLMFEKLFGWSGVLIEADRGFFPDLRKNRVCRVGGREGACVWAMLGETRTFLNNEGGGEHAVEMHSLNSVMDHLGLTHIHYMSADCEGCEASAFRSLDMARYSVDVLTVEFPTCEILTKFARRGYVAFPLYGTQDVVFVHPSVAAKMPPPELPAGPKMPQPGWRAAKKLAALVASWDSACPEAAKRVWREGDAWPPAVGTPP